MAKCYWICPSCSTKNYTVCPGEARMMILVEQWDYCKSCKTERGNTEVRVVSRI